MSLFASKASMLLLSTAALCHVYNGEDAGVASLKLKVRANGHDDDELERAISLSLLPEQHDVELQRALAADAEAERERLLQADEDEQEQLALAMSLSAKLSEDADQLSEVDEAIFKESLRAEEQRRLRAETFAQQEKLQVSKAKEFNTAKILDGTFAPMPKSSALERARTANGKEAEGIRVSQQERDGDGAEVQGAAAFGSEVIHPGSSISASPRRQSSWRFPLPGRGSSNSTYNRLPSLDAQNVIGRLTSLGARQQVDPSP